MSALKDQTREKIEEAAEGAKKLAGKAIDKTRDLAHSAGKKIEKGGKRLKSV